MHKSWLLLPYMTALLCVGHVGVRHGMPMTIAAIAYPIEWVTIMEVEKPTESFNFTKAAQGKRAQNLLIIRDRTLTEHYMQNC